MGTVFLKELADHFGRRRFVVLAGIIILAGMWAGFVAARSLRGVSGDLPSELIFLQMFTAGSGFLPPFLFFLSFFGPLIGITLGFDSINSERSQGTLARTLSQPIYRDALFNGKFLAGVATIAIIQASIVLVVIGLGMIILGFAPSIEALLRIVLFGVASVVYMSFWLVLAMLTSVWLGRAVSSALTSLALWLFFGFIMLMLAGGVADLIVPDTAEQADALRHIRIQDIVLRFSPVTLFEEATATLLTPTTRSLGPVVTQQLQGLQSLTPLPLSQSLLLIWPHLVAMLGLAGVCFGISYVRFLREEVRP